MKLYLRVILVFFFLVLTSKSFAEYPKYDESKVDRSNLLYFYASSPAGVCLEADLLKHIDAHEVSSVLEIGSRDGRDAINLSEYYKCHVFTFECNPDCLDLCRYNLRNATNVSLIEKAAWNETKEISFYPVIAEPGKLYDPGSSSCFKMGERALKNYTQSEAIIVPAVRVDEWLQEMQIDHIDMLCMDTQGATLNILEGMGEYLIKTKYIITECMHREVYIGEQILPELFTFLYDKGFELVTTSQTIDFLFINTREDFN